MSSSNWCFLTCIQISQEACQVVWYSHLFQNFPQFIVIHTVKGFGIVNKAEMDVFLELSCFFHDQWMLAIWSLVPLPFLKPAWPSGSSGLIYCWSLAWRILSMKNWLMLVERKVGFNQNAGNLDRWLTHCPLKPLLKILFSLNLFLKRKVMPVNYWDDSQSHCHTPLFTGFCAGLWTSWDLFKDVILFTQFVSEITEGKARQ